MDRSGRHDAAPRHRRSFRPRHLSELVVVWPANRRVLYNRASCDPEGSPGTPTASRSGGTNRSSAGWATTFPISKLDSPPKDHMGPFIMNPEGVGRLFAPLAAFADGPFPEHYEPVESPTDNRAASRSIQESRGASRFTSTADKFGSPAEGYNIVCTTFRLTEHYHYWTKNNPMNVQLVPEPFVEIPAELADEMGLRGGETRQSVQRARPLHRQGHGHAPHQAHDHRWQARPTRSAFRFTGAIAASPKTKARPRCTPANMLSPAVIDPNAYTPEFKGFLVKLEKLAMSANLRIQAISGRTGPVARRRYAAPAAPRQADRHHHLHRLQGLRSRLHGVERSSLPRNRFSTTPTRPCPKRRGTTGT